jgi:hypothetical protein
MSGTTLIRRSDLIEIQRQIDSGKSGHIYFITNSEAETVKIGYATDVRRRLESLQTGNHVKLLLYSGFPATAHLERVLHRAVKDLRIFNEWFRHTDLLDELISCFEDKLSDRVDHVTPFSPAEVEFVIDDWLNSYGRGRSARPCGQTVDNRQ